MTGISFSFDPDWMYTLSAPFMTNAFLAGLCISLAAGVMGYFTIARHSTFAAHALAHIGLPGATGAVLLGLPVSLGMGVFALGGALVIGALGKRATQREIATGTVLAFATGLGLFFARLSSSASQQMQSILFGSILTITTDQILGFAVFDVILLAVLPIVYRPLLFSSVDEQVAQAKGVPIGLMNVAFMAIMAGVITIAVPAVGTLLIFALVITPAATANAIVEAPVLLRPLSSVASTLPFGLGLTAGFCGSGLVDGSCGPGFSPSTFTRAFRAACSAASASAAWAGVASSSAATFFAASKAAWNASQPDSYLSSVSFSAAAIALFNAVLSAALTLTSKVLEYSVSLSVTVNVALPTFANGFA